MTDDGWRFEDADQYEKTALGAPILRRGDRDGMDEADDPGLAVLILIVIAAAPLYVTYRAFTADGAFLFSHPVADFFAIILMCPLVLVLMSALSNGWIAGAIGALFFLNTGAAASGSLIISALGVMEIAVFATLAASIGWLRRRAAPLRRGQVMNGIRWGVIGVLAAFVLVQTILRSPEGYAWATEAAGMSGIVGALVLAALAAGLFAISVWATQGALAWRARRRRRP